MQKKKSPIILIAVVSIGLLIFVLANATNLVSNPGQVLQNREAEQPTKTTAQPVSSEQSARNKQTLASQAGVKQPSAEEKGEIRPTEKDGVPVEPAIIVRDVKPTKPIVNDSAISGQWYRDGSRQKARSEKMAKERAAASGT